MGGQQGRCRSLRGISAIEFSAGGVFDSGFKGAAVLRRPVGDEVEFTTITRFESVEAIKKFAGEDYEAAHVAPRARELLSRFDARCVHSELVIETSPPTAAGP